MTLMLQSDKSSSTPISSRPPATHSAEPDQQPKLAAALAVLDTIAGKFQILDLLGQGGSIDA